METIHLQYSETPSLTPALFRAIFVPRKGFKARDGLPQIKADWLKAKIDILNLSNYLDCCNLEDDGYLPLLYPHVIASRIHLNMLTHRSFPIKLLGSVHLRNHIIQHRKITTNETLSIACQITDYRIVEKGLEFDFTSLFTVGIERVWESISTYYVRGKFGQVGEESPLTQLDKLEDATEIAKWHVASNLGKRYAKITGDYNPIHISGVLAKLFGFKKDLIHGFCALATAIGKLPTFSSNSPIRLDVAFKGPVYLDESVVLQNKEVNQSHRFDVYCGDNDRPSISGLLKEVDGTDKLV